MSGTRGVPLAIAVRRPAVPDPLAPSLVEAELRFELDTNGKLTFTTSTAELRLAVQRGIDAEGPYKLPPGAHWRLVLRPEPIVAAGSYGADAVTAARPGGVVGAERRPRKDDLVFDIDAKEHPDIGKREGTVLRPI